MNLLQRIDQVACVSQAQIEGKGEDSFAYCIGEDIVFAGVFDGCGGLGSKVYERFGNHTGAYVGSRIASGVFNDYFSTEGALKDKNVWVSDLAERLTAAMQRYKKGDVSKLQLKGSMTKDFPTTVAASVIKPSGNGITGSFIWAGDSRGYVFYQNGLRQITIDDLSGQDAMSNITGDGVLTNVVSASPFELHYRECVINSPALIISATDGCFNYLQSPMHFEYLLLYALINSGSTTEWEKKISELLKHVAGDDYTMTMVIYGFGDFESIKRYYLGRMDYMAQKYIEPWSKLDDNSKLALWKQYSRELEGTT